MGRTAIDSDSYQEENRALQGDQSFGYETSVSISGTENNISTVTTSTMTLTTSTSADSDGPIGSHNDQPDRMVVAKALTDLELQQEMTSRLGDVPVAKIIHSKEKTRRKRQIIALIEVAIVVGVALTVGLTLQNSWESVTYESQVLLEFLQGESLVAF